MFLDEAYRQEDEYLATLTALVATESPSRDKAACDLLADLLVNVFTSDGWTVTRYPRSQVGDIVEARYPGPPDGPRTLLLAHYDTVWPLGTLDEMPLRREGDKVFGPGTCDMKAGIASALHALRILRVLGHPPFGPVTALITSDEEIGSRQSRELIEEAARRHDRVLVLETSRDDGAVKIGRKGVGEFRVTFRGRSAHAGNDPHLGASALRELAHFLLFVEDLADPEAGTTVNLTIGRGGTASNVIAEKAEATVDVRVLRMEEGQRVEAAIRGYRPVDPRVTLEVEGAVDRPPLEPTGGNLELWREAQERLADLGLHLESSVVGGGSDGNFTSALGVPTLDGIGSAGAGSHARHEHIRVRESLERVALLAALLAGGANAA